MEHEGLRRCVSRFFTVLGRVGDALDLSAARRAEILKDYESLTEDLKPEILACLQVDPLSSEIAESLVATYGWTDLYLRSFVFWFLFYVGWVWTQLGVRLEGEELEDMFRIWVHGTLGYRLLDLFLDERKAGDVGALQGLYLITEHELELIRLFGPSPLTLEHIYDAKEEWFTAELLEKTCRNKRCPISVDEPLKCASKAAPIFVPFAVALARHGEAELIPTYKELIYRLVASTQILDDLSDLEEDLSHGLFTLGCCGLEEELSRLSPLEGANLVRGDAGRMRNLYEACRDLSVGAVAISRSIDDPLFEMFAEYRILLLGVIFFGKEVPYGVDG